MSNSMMRRHLVPGVGSRKTGNGNRHHVGLKRIVVAFDDETFEQVRKRAARSKTSFAAEVRLLVEFGLETSSR
jgi:hypothetical protein